MSDLRSFGLTPGVEEVAAIAVCQKIMGKDCAKAKLINCEQRDYGRDTDAGADVDARGGGGRPSWKVDFDDDPDRIRYHQEKMKSKIQRPRGQMLRIGLESFGVVHHI